MTDKQIIIDGVNVKDCKRRIGKDNYCRYYKRPCAENNYNCIWKKYLRKEQECEELKKQLERKEENYQKLLNKSNKYIHNLVDENVQDISNLGRQLDQLKADNEHLSEKEEEAKHYLEEAEKFKNCLIEIKEIAEKTLNMVDYKTYFKRDNKSLKQEGFKALNEILQKISECEVNNDNKQRKTSKNDK